MSSSGDKLLQTLHGGLTTQLVEQLRRCDAPWQRAVRAGSALPYNPHNNKRFHGVNVLNLLAQSREDPRWMTREQAEARGAFVRDGEQGTLVHAWQFHETLQGQAPRPLARPRLATAVVFNAAQIDGLEPLARSSHADDGAARAWDMVLASGAHVREADKRAQYDFASDTLYVPERARLREDPEMAARTLRALARWTGHPSRLARGSHAPMGTMAAAAEELRAAIYVTMFVHEHGLVLAAAPRLDLRDMWIGALERDPFEIGRAATDVERMRLFLNQTNRQEHRQYTQVSRASASTNEAGMQQKPKQYLAVPYVDRHRAYALGARLDRDAKCWYIGPNADHDALARWLPSGHTMPVSGNAREEFAALLRSLGLEVSGAHPIMDGRRHRLHAEGDRGREKAGYYIGRLDGIPNGFAGNYRTGQTSPWSARGRVFSAEDLAELRAQTAQAAAARAEERRKLERIAADKVQACVSLLQPLQASPYLDRKQIRATEGALAIADGRNPEWWPFQGWPCRDGMICLPARDADGQLRTMQYIAPDGAKRFEPNSFKRGCFHVVAARALPTATALVIAEGYATAATIHEALGNPRIAVVAAFDSGNLPEVAAALRAKHPRKPIVVAGDNDARLLQRAPFKNVGLEKAHEAATAVKGVAVVPTFPRGTPEALTDFNDLVTLGLSHRATMVRQLRGAIELAMKRLMSHEHARPRPLVRSARG